MIAARACMGLAVLSWVALGAACSSAPHAPAASATEAPRAAQEEVAPERVATADAGTLSANPDSPATAAPAAEAEAPDAGPPELTAADVLALSPSVSTSIGSPGAGEVRGAVALPDEGPGFRHNARRPRIARFGTVEMVQGLIKAAAAGSLEDIVVINDIGRPHGGPIEQHGSHQAGRDVDVLFFSTDLKGKPVPSVGVPIDPKGRGIDFKDLAVRGDDVDLRFDAKRTWRFVASLIEQTGDDIQRIFIVEHVRTMLLAEAARVKAKKKIVERFEMVTCQPETPHDDHMHVRLFCSAEDIAAGCVDGSPMMPFRRQALKKLGVTPVLETYAMRHDKKRLEGVDERTTSEEEARAKIESSGPMHARVRRFLEEREAWVKKPETGRPYCK